MKRKALAKAHHRRGSTRAPAWRRNTTILEWLEAL